jgi:hypothetical protein
MKTIIRTWGKAHLKIHKKRIAATLAAVPGALGKYPIPKTLEKPNDNRARSKEKNFLSEWILLKTN